ncbi:unnamed protein product [Camellia sinensis]
MQLTWYPDRDANILLAIQVNVFDCNSIAIAASFFSEVHGWTFFKSWAAHSRNSHTKTVSPKFNLAMLFPPSEVGKRYRVVQAVNLSPRANLPLPKLSFGNVGDCNLSQFAKAVPSMERSEEDGYGLVKQQGKLMVIMSRNLKEILMWWLKK